MDSFWIHFGVVLGSFWWPLGDPNRAKFDPKPIFFFDRFWLLFWVHFGSDLGPILCPFGRPIRPKFNPKSSLNRFAYETRSPTACCDFVGFCEPLIRFKTALSGSQRTSFFMLNFVFDFGPFWAPFWRPLGSLWAPQTGPRGIKK